MWGLFELLRFSFSSIIWGILITAICLTLFFLLIRGWYRNAAFTPVSYLIGFFLFLLLAFQCTMIVGAIKIIHITPYYKTQIQQLVSTYFPPSQEITGQESEQVIDWLVTEYPILQYYFDSGEFTGYTAQQLPAVMGAEIRSFLRFYIVRRLLWCLGFVIAGAVLVIRSIAREHKRNDRIVKRDYRKSRPIRRVSRRF